MSPRPIAFSWDGEAFYPASPLWAKRADEHFVVGKTYRLVPYEDRSINSHNHYFASIAEAWQNLPEHLADQFPTSEHLRRYALIKAGFCEERSVPVATNAEALRVVAAVKPLDEYALIVAGDNVVRIFTAKSQSMRAMDKAEFQKSKTAVLDVISDMIGVSAKALDKNAGRAA